MGMMTLKDLNVETCSVLIAKIIARFIDSLDLELETVKKPHAV